jgi:hypothetical protein
MSRDLSSCLPRNSNMLIQSVGLFQHIIPRSTRRAGNSGLPELVHAYAEARFVKQDPQTMLSELHVLYIFIQLQWNTLWQSSSKTRVHPAVDGRRLPLSSTRRGQFQMASWLRPLEVRNSPLEKSTAAVAQTRLQDCCSVTLTSNVDHGSFNHQTTGRCCR